MKNINFKKILILAILNFIACKSQTLPLNTELNDIPENAHVKDLNNELTPYIGNYKAIYEGNEITLSITKESDKITNRNKIFFRDALVIKYIIKNSNGIILQNTQNLNNSENIIYSYGTDSIQNKIYFTYSGTNCNVGWGRIILSKINANQISWLYRPNITELNNCPSGSDLNIYLPITDNLIFTKQ